MLATTGNWFFGDASHDLVGGVPIGSRLSELDRHLPRWRGKGEVAEWIPETDPAKADVVNQLGHFRVVGFRSYEGWKATVGERDSFTGQISFTDESFTSTDMNVFVYAKGRLVWKYWGFLPG